MELPSERMEPRESSGHLVKKKQSYDPRRGEILNLESQGQKSNKETEPLRQNVGEIIELPESGGLKLFLGSSCL